MQTIKLTYPHTLIQEELPETVAAIGFFDGIHRGHQKLIQTAIDEAAGQERESAVITLFPHPSVVLKKDKQHVEYLTPLHEKEDILEEIGVDRLYIITFNNELASLDPQEFVDHFIIGLRVKHLIAGFDFSYGHKGKGSMETMPIHSRGEFQQTIIDKVESDNQKISSTIIREHLGEGNIEKANELLGRSLAAHGTVIEGEQRGRTIGFPTANVKPSDDYLFPKVGVYAVTIKRDNQTLYGMANLGYNPTFEDQKSDPVLEVHIFDYNDNLYGEELTIEWQLFIREEQKFNSVEELVNQIKQDERLIRKYFNL